MILKSFGCSFIYGSDLADDGRNQTHATPSKLTWPALLAQSLNYDYACYARPGSGNLQILERILTQAACNEPALSVIGWTWIDRFDYVADSNKSTGARLGNQWWHTIMPNSNNNLAITYYRDLHSQYRDKLVALTSIKLAIDTLKQKGHSFIMTYMDESIFQTDCHSNPAITDLQDYVRPYMTRFEGQTFLEFSKQKGFPISETLHPLEPAHQAAFELIKLNLDATLHKA